MNEGLEQALFEDFPGLYRLGLGWGFQCGDGWYGLLRRLSAKLEPLGVTAQQVKNKYGQLRFYLDVGIFTDQQWDNVRDIIDEAEIESETTCATCGNLATYAGLCDLHREATYIIPWGQRS